MADWHVRWSVDALEGLSDVAGPDLRERIWGPWILSPHSLSGELLRSRVFGAVRRTSVTPFVVLYVPIEESHTVHILAVQDGRRNCRALS